MIPRMIQLHHFFGSGLADPATTMAIYKQMMPDYDIVLHTDVDLPDEYDEILDSPDIEDRFKADVFRYWYLYKYGGVYVDMDTRPLRRFDDILDSDKPVIAAVTDSEGRVHPYFCLAASPVGDTLWLDCLAHCRKRYDAGIRDLFNISSVSHILSGRVTYLVDSVGELPQISLRHYILHFRQSAGNAPPQEESVSATITRGGQMVFPHIGLPPKCPEGYEHTNDPFVFRPILRKCKYREIKVKTTKCCGTQSTIVCHHPMHDGIGVYGKTCKRCQDKWKEGPDDISGL